MFVIVTYDVGSKRVGKALKVCRKYLHSVHRSVFEGGLTERELRCLKRELKRVINPDHDSVRIYRLESTKFVSKYYIGSTAQPQQII